MTSSVYRIDHYLGKEDEVLERHGVTASRTFELIWSNFIDDVQITAAEDLGIGRERSTTTRRGPP